MMAWISEGRKCKVIVDRLEDYLAGTSNIARIHRLTGSMRWCRTSTRNGRLVAFRRCALRRQFTPASFVRLNSSSRTARRARSGAFSTGAGVRRRVAFASRMAPCSERFYVRVKPSTRPTNQP
jgi:hypothetical protein